MKNREKKNNLHFTYTGTWTKDTTLIILNYSRNSI